MDPGNTQLCLSMSPACVHLLTGIESLSGKEKIPILRAKYYKNWKHLAKLNLADPDFGIPGYINVLLGIDVFNKVVRQGRRTGPLGHHRLLRLHSNGCYRVT